MWFKTSPFVCNSAKFLETGNFPCLDLCSLWQFPVVQACCLLLESMPSITHKWETINTSGRCSGIRADRSKWTGPLTARESITVSQHHITQSEYQLVVFLIVLNKSFKWTRWWTCSLHWCVCSKNKTETKQIALYRGLWQSVSLNKYALALTKWRFESEWMSGVALSKICNFWTNWMDMACWL